MPTLRHLLLTSTSLMLVATIAIPAAQAQSGERGGRRGPPPEALEACTDKVEGDACSFSGPRGDVEGSCIVPPRGEESLICGPADGHRELAPPATENQS